MGLKHWFSRSQSSKPKRKSDRRWHGLEVLEDRLAPAIDVWTGANFAVDQNWSDGGNWSLGVAPTASDVAAFTNNASTRSFTSVVDQDFTVAGLMVDGSWGGKINVNAPLTLSSGGTSEWDSGSLAVAQGVTLTNNGTLNLKNSNFDYLGFGGTVQNNGTINQEGGVLALVGNGNVALTFNNAAGAVYDFQSDSSIVSGGFDGGMIFNSGTIEKTAGVGTSLVGQPLINTGGTLDAASGTLGISGGNGGGVAGFVSDDNGTFIASAGAILDLTGGSQVTFNETGNFTASGAGEISFGSGTLAIGSTGSTITVPSSVSFNWSGGTISVPVGATLDYNGVLRMGNSATVYLRGGGTFQVNGTINQGSGNLALAGNDSANVITTLMIPTGSVYNFGSDSGIFSGGLDGGQIINSGTIEKTAGTGTSLVGEPLINTGGTLDAASGTLGITGGNGGGAAGFVSDDNGTFTAAAGAILDLTGSSQVTFNEIGNFTAAGAGEISFNSGTLSIGSTGSTITVPSSVSFNWSGGTIAVPVGATLSYNGVLTMGNSATVFLRGGGTFLDNGTINQGSGNLALAGNDSANVITTLMIPTGSVYNFGSDSGIFSGGLDGGQIINSGTIEKTAGTGTSLVGEPLINTGGALDAASGTLGITGGNGGGAAGFVSSDNGTFAASAGAILDLTGSSQVTFNETGTFTAAGAGEISFGSGTLAIGSTGSTITVPSSVSFNWSGGTISVPVGATLSYNGVLTMGNSATVFLRGGGTFLDNGTINQESGNLALVGNDSGNVVTTLMIPAGAVYDFQGNSGIYSGGLDGGVVDNAGTIEKTAGGATSVINVGFNNTGGTLSVTTGTLTIESTGGENTGGAFNVASGAVLDLTGGQQVNYSGTYTGSGAGEVLLAGGILNVTGGTAGATFNLPGNLFTWSGGTIQTSAANNLTVLGSMAIAGSTTEFLQGGGSLNVGSGSTAGTINDTGTGNTLTIGAGTSLNVAANGTLSIADDVINGSGLLEIQGALVKSAGTSAATISTAMDNQGSIQVNDGTLLLNGTVDQVFNSVLTGGSWSALGSPTVSATIDITSASFTTIGTGAIVALNGPNSAFSNLASLALNQGQFSLLGGQSFGTAGNFTSAGTLTLSPGSVLTVNGNFVQSSTGSLNIQLGGTASKRLIGSLVVKGTVTLAGNLSVTSTLVVPIGSVFKIVDNQGTSPVSGAFAGLPKGARFKVKVGSSTMTFRINYSGGTGNDVTIRRIA
jgi:hypothetical protein